MPKRNDIPSTIHPGIIRVWYSDSGEEVPVETFLSRISEMLEVYRSVLQQLVDYNADILPTRENTKFGTKWARDNVALPKPPAELFPEDYIDKSNTLYILQHNAVQKILPYQKRKDLVEQLDALNLWNESYAIVKEVLGKSEYLDSHWLKNINQAHDNAVAKGEKCKPAIPQIKSMKFEFSLGQRCIGQITVFKDAIWVHRLIIGANRYDVLFSSADVFDRFPRLLDVKRPTVRFDAYSRQPVFDFPVIEAPYEKEPEYTLRHAVFFDRNCDWTKAGGIQPITGVRMNDNGVCSDPKGASLRTIDNCVHLRNQSQEKQRKKLKIERLMPWQQTKGESLASEVKAIEHAQEETKRNIDFSLCDDMMRHSKGDELIGVERLDMFGGGPVKFRHGSTDDKLSHMASRRNKQIEKCNPSDTSRDCPRCHEHLKENKDTRIATCPNCGYVDDHDAVAPPNIATRTFEKLGRNIQEVHVEDLNGKAVKSERKRAKRLAKMDRRKAAGKRVYHVKDKPTPDRPPNSYSGDIGSAYDELGYEGENTFFDADSVGEVVAYLIGTDEFIDVMNEVAKSRCVAEQKTTDEGLPKSDADNVSDTTREGGGEPEDTAGAGHGSPVVTADVEQQSRASLKEPARVMRKAWARTGTLFPNRYGNITSNAYFSVIFDDWETNPRKSKKQSEKG